MAGRRGIAVAGAVLEGGFGGGLAQPGAALGVLILGVGAGGAVGAMGAGVGAVLEGGLGGGVADGGTALGAIGTGVGGTG